MSRKAKITPKERLLLWMSIYGGLATGLISAVVVTATYELIHNLNEVSLFIYIIVWVATGLILWQMRSNIKKLAEYVEV
jgi:RsiW-degrading membrane proteinase PrsW (M82 family)